MIYVTAEHFVRVYELPTRYRMFIKELRDLKFKYLPECHGTEKRNHVT
jgi:hypothetical protein